MEIVPLTDESLLECDLCGVPLENPFLLSSSVVASTYDICARAFEAGWAGAAFKTICSFNIHEASPRFSAINGADGGHQAIRLNENRWPILNSRRCVGCHLCVLVCPQRAIRSGGKRVLKPKLQ